MWTECGLNVECKMRLSAGWNVDLDVACDVDWNVGWDVAGMLTAMWTEM